jgi:hypothetical protein
MVVAKGGVFREASSVSVKLSYRNRRQPIDYISETRFAGAVFPCAKFG